MAHAIQWLRSLIFVGQMYLMMFLMGLAFAIPAALSRDWALRAMHLYCHWVRWSARWIVGLRTEVRGTPPEGEVLVAAKHQSFLDIIMIFSVLPRPRFIMKAELTRAPVLGLYALRTGCIPVERGKRGQAIAKMVADVAAGRRQPGQLIIYPQGTRIAPGVSAPYKVGTAILYRETGQTVVPAATNVGVFWARTGIFRKPGVAVVEFLPPIPPGLSDADFMAKLEHTVETASDALLSEAGFR